MPDQFTHSADFHLALRCLEGDDAAVARLVNTYTEPTWKFLRSAGATEPEAREVIDQLWTDCVAPSCGRKARLTGYGGRCALQTWLNTVALNTLLSSKRSEERWTRLVPARVQSSAGEREEPEWESPVLESERLEEPLLALMRDAIENAFQHCPPEQFVLLQLVHCDGLRLAEVAEIFGCSIATASRQLERASREIAATTLARLKESDPWLELTWHDFVALCHTATPACFGQED